MKGRSELSYLFTQAWIHQCVFYLLGYNPVLYYFFAQIVIALVIGKFFKLLFLLTFLFSFSYVLKQRDALVSSYIFPCPQPFLQGDLIPSIGECFSETKFWVLNRVSLLRGLLREYMYVY